MFFLSMRKPIERMVADQPQTSHRWFQVVVIRTSRSEFLPYLRLIVTPAITPDVTKSANLVLTANLPPLR